MPVFHLAELNIARLLHPLDDPRIHEFVDGLDSINRLADQSPGFVWRLKTESGNATDAHHPWSQDPFMLVNLSIWESPESLREYTYKSNHLDYLRRRTEWFERPTDPHYVLWWVQAGQIPTLEEAQNRLTHYRTQGPTPKAFWFNTLYPAPLAVPI